jgi:hypothetical protein
MRAEPDAAYRMPSSRRGEAQARAHQDDRTEDALQEIATEITKQAAT